MAHQADKEGDGRTHSGEPSEYPLFHQGLTEEEKSAEQGQKSYRKFSSAKVFRNFWITMASIVSPIVVAFFSYALWQTSNDQIQLMQRQLDVAAYANRVATEAIEVAAEGNRVATEAIKVAAEENKIARETALFEKRPWISIKVSVPDSEAQFVASNKGYFFKVATEVHNFGNLPALYNHAESSLFIHDFLKSEVVACGETIGGYRPELARSILPGETIIVEGIPRLSQTDAQALDAEVKSSTMWMKIGVCLNYWTPGRDTVFRSHVIGDVVRFSKSGYPNRQFINQENWASDTSGLGVTALEVKYE